MPPGRPRVACWSASLACSPPSQEFRGCRAEPQLFGHQVNERTLQSQLCHFAGQLLGGLQLLEALLDVLPDAQLIEVVVIEVVIIEVALLVEIVEIVEVIFRVIGRAIAPSITGCLAASKRFREIRLAAGAARRRNPRRSCQVL
jgi:hypothetical protein